MTRIPREATQLKPYYEDDACTIYHGDCLELWPLWDLAGAVMVTDPPYGMRYQSNMGRDGRGGYRSVQRDTVVADESTAVRDEVLGLWDPRPALVFGTWRAERPSATKLVLTWDKGNCPGLGDLSIPWGLSTEEVYVLGSGFVGKRTPNVLRHDALMSGDSSRPDHPTPKPLGLMRDLIGKCPPLADVVDPFMGSGTTLRAAKDLGRKAIGIEIEERYCEIAAKRLAQEVLPL